MRWCWAGWARGRSQRGRAAPVRAQRCQELHLCGSHLCCRWSIHPGNHSRPFPEEKAAEQTLLSSEASGELSCCSQLPRTAECGFWADLRAGMFTAAHGRRAQRAQLALGQQRAQMALGQHLVAVSPLTQRKLPQDTCVEVGMDPGLVCVRTGAAELSVLPVRPQRAPWEAEQNLRGAWSHTDPIWESQHEEPNPASPEGALGCSPINHGKRRTIPTCMQPSGLLRSSRRKYQRVWREKTQWAGNSCQP